LKLLLLNYTDSGGGAAIAAFRLLKALRKYGVEADLGVVEKKSADASVLSLKESDIHRYCIEIRRFRKLFNKVSVYLKMLLRIDFKTSNPILHSENKKTVIDINYINNSDYDLVHLHWINNDMISIEDIRRIKKPIVWTMHDTWVYCGAEHYPNILENDKRFIAGYFRANKPKTTTGRDICRKTWERKKKAWKNCRFNFISPSNFEKKQLEASALFPRPVCEVIPNIIPESIFRPIDKKAIKDIYQIPIHKKIIGFGAASNLKDEKSIKGERLLFNALQMVDKPDDYYCIIMGNADSSFVGKIKIPVFVTGFIDNPYILAAMYNACDVFVCPSILENLPNVCLESLFSGVPVAAFETGGIPDIVEHKKTGYLAKPFDTEDLCRGILYCIDNYAELSRNSLHKAKVDFNAETIIKKHIDLYRKVLTTQENSPS
jgi:glycosyltransferase involved in cell wall biosynthesis